MRLDKKKCRKYADKGLKLPLNSRSLPMASTIPAVPMVPTLPMEKISYIVRTVVRIVGHHKVLILYFYPGKRLCHGETMPKLTMFHSRDDYITLERRDDGTTVWRKAAFENLFEYGVSSRIAFLTPEDEERVSNFFREKGKSGFCALRCVQGKIMNRRYEMRQRKRETQTLERMKALSALPKDIDSWLAHRIMPAYFFYDYKKGKKMAKGICTSCGREVEMANARYNAKGVCPHCRREVTMKSKGRKGRIWDQEMCQVIQNVGNGEVVARIFRAWFFYPKEGVMPEKSRYETARIFMRQELNGRFTVENYYNSDQGILTRWKPGDRPRLWGYWYYPENEKCGHVYCRNLSRALDGTPWRYCPLEAFYSHYRMPMELEGFFQAFLKHPRLEHLVKAGFFQLASDMAYRGNTHNILDETKNRTHQILMVGAEDVPFLKEIDAGWETLKHYQRYCAINLKGRQELLLWEKRNKVGMDVLEMLHYMTPYRLTRYVDRQYARLLMEPDGHARYSAVADVLREYRDYLNMCVKQDYDMGNNSVLFPKNLQKAHDREAKRIKVKADAIKRKKFKEAYKKIAHRYDFEADGMKIVYPSVPSDLSAEGNALQHCVGGYVNKVAEGKCIILFLRECENPEESFYTIELEGKKVAQVRGIKNCAPSREVDEFVKRWEKEVLNAPAMERAA